MVNLDDYVFYEGLEKFSTELLKGITERPAYCVEIMEKAFGKDNHISPILSHKLADVYEKSILSLLKQNKIVESNKFRDNLGQYTVFTTSYKRA